MEIASRITAGLWVAGGLFRMVLAATGAIPMSSASAMWTAVAVGLLASVAIAAAFWFRPGRGSAILGLVFSFPSVLGLMAFRSVDLGLAGLAVALPGIVTFLMSGYCYWRARQPVSDPAA